ncbi:hypothetical protein CLOM_g7919 [Closterium sp. NIES-68]|nr:hypothetical protein CLOM_g7919 [Closterium sp. NIES-68]
MTAEVQSSRFLLPLLPMAHSTPVSADPGASAFAPSSLHSAANPPSEPFRGEQGFEGLEPINPFSLSRSSIVVSAITAAAAATSAANLANQHCLQPMPGLQSPADVSLPIDIPPALRGTAVVAVTGAGIEANALSPHSTLSGGVTQKIFLSTQSFRSFPPNLPLSALGSCSSSGSSSPCGGTAERGSQSLSAKRNHGGSENLLKRINFSMSMPNLHGWLRNKDRRLEENYGGSAHGPEEGSDLAAIFEVPQITAPNAAQNPVQIAVRNALQNVDGSPSGIAVSRSHKETVREVSWTGAVGVTEGEDTTTRSPGKWRISRSSRSHREHHSRTGWATIGDKIRLSSLSSSRLLPGKNFLRSHHGSMNAMGFAGATGAMGPSGGEDLINMSLAQSCAAPAPGNPQRPTGVAAEAAGAEGGREGEGADCEGGEAELLGLEAEEGIVVSWSLSSDAGGRGDGGAVCASTAEAGDSAGGAEWAEGVAGEDRMQVVASGNGYVFSAVYDGFTDTSAADFLLANLHTRFAEQLVARGLHFGEAKSYASPAAAQGTDCAAAETAADVAAVKDAGFGGQGEAAGGAQVQVTPRRHEKVLEALAAALSETEAAYFESLEERMAERLELGVAGACLVVAVVAGRELYVMNLGDCRAVVVAEGGEGRRWRRGKARRRWGSCARRC